MEAIPITMNRRKADGGREGVFIKFLGAGDPSSHGREVVSYLLVTHVVVSVKPLHPTLSHYWESEI